VRTFRRWFLRLLALAALCGVGYAAYTIIKEGTKDDKPAASQIAPALKKLAASQLSLGNKLDHLVPGRKSSNLLGAIKTARKDQEAVVSELRRRQSKKLDTPDEADLDDALGAEFDYLDAVNSVARNSKSKLLKSLANRAQAAKDAFTKLPDSQGVEDGVKGTQAFLTWARARR
jgi:hypothetical protein